jgi:thiol-disulfide isomerase/thioredoxin
MRFAFDAPIEASGSDLERMLMSGPPALVVFETPDCDPCVALRPVLEKLAREFRDRVRVIRVSESSVGWLAARYNLTCVPTLLFWRAGAERARIRGNLGAAAIRAYLEYLVTGESLPDHTEGRSHTLSAHFGGTPPAVAPRAQLP